MSKVDFRNMGHSARFLMRILYGEDCNWSTRQGTYFTIDIATYASITRQSKRDAMLQIKKLQALGLVEDFEYDFTFIYFNLIIPKWLKLCEEEDATPNKNYLSL